MWRMVVVPNSNFRSEDNKKTRELKWLRAGAAEEDAATGDSG